LIKNNAIWIRTASINDIEAIHALLQASWHASYDDLIGAETVTTIVSDWYDPMQIAQDINQPEAEYIVADDGVTLYGVAHALSGILTDNPDTVLIHQLCVSPLHQCQGLGGQLLDELESCFPAAPRFQVRLAEKNERALQFFTHRGYAHLEENKQERPDAHFFEVLLEKEII